MTDWLEQLLELLEQPDQAREGAGEALLAALSALPTVPPSGVGAARETGRTEPGEQGETLSRREEEGAEGLRRALAPLRLSAPGAQEGEPSSALPQLYRRVRRAAGQGYAPAVPPHLVQTALESGQAPPGLTVAELDRAVRRDSRRYDGGMSIY